MINETTPLVKKSRSLLQRFSDKVKSSSTTRLHPSDGESVYSEADSLFENDPFRPALIHCHSNQPPRELGDPGARKTLIITCILCLLFMIAEIVGGYLADSLAIMTDAAHLLTDVASFLISLFSLYMAARPPSRTMSFGWHRAEVLGALISVFLIWVVTGILCYIAAQRIINNEYNIEARIMLMTAALGVTVNIVMGCILHFSGHGHSHGIGGGHGHSHDSAGHGHSHDAPIVENGVLNGKSTRDKLNSSALTDIEIDDEKSILIEETEDHAIVVRREGTHKKNTNINVRAAFIHVIGDLLQSVGVFTAALIIYFRPDLAVIDPICTFLFSILVLITTIAILRDALNVLMEGIPRGIDIAEVTRALDQLPGVVRVHDLRIWSLTIDKVALSVHVVIEEPKNSHEILSKATNLLVQNFNIYECTVQIEQFSRDMQDCVRCEPP